MSEIIKPGEFNGHPSASQRREKALQAELLQTRILADHLRAIIVLMLKSHPNEGFECSKEAISAHLGHPFNSYEDTLRNVIQFTLPPITEIPVDTVPRETPKDPEPS